MHPGRRRRRSSEAIKLKYLAFHPQKDPSNPDLRSNLSVEPTECNSYCERRSNCTKKIKPNPTHLISIIWVPITKALSEQPRKLFLTVRLFFYLLIMKKKTEEQPPKTVYFGHSVTKTKYKSNRVNTIKNNKNTKTVKFKDEYFPQYFKNNTESHQ